MTYRFIPFFINVGLVRLMRAFNRLPVTPPSVTGHHREVLEVLWFQPKFFRAAFGEMSRFEESAGQARSSGSLGETPFAVLVATRPDPGDDEPYVRAWVDELQPGLARLSNRGRLIHVDSNHMIPYERPEAITEAVREMVERLRSEQQFQPQLDSPRVGGGQDLAK